MISVTRLSKVFEDPGSAPIVAVDDASFECRSGEIYGLLGPNGAGKTTTLRCLATTFMPTSGRVTICGHDVATDSEAARRELGFMSASLGLYQRLTPRETLRLFAALHDVPAATIEARVEATLALFDVTKYADRPNDRLSTGMKQRVSLARAIVHDPRVVILDEPTSGLDPVVSASVEEAIQLLSKAGKCVLLSTHMLGQAADLCDRLGIIDKGRIVAEGTVESVCATVNARTLKEAFFALVGAGERP